MSVAKKVACYLYNRNYLILKKYVLMLHSAVYRNLKNCAASLVNPLCHLFLLSRNSKTIPREWKMHTITPVYKSGDKSNLKNYRPISLLSSISKVLERLIYNKITEHLSKTLSHYQFGFQKLKSTLQQQLLYFNDLVFLTTP